MKFTLKINNRNLEFTGDDRFFSNGHTWICVTKTVSKGFSRYDLPMPKTKCDKWLKEGVLVETSPGKREYSFVSVPKEALENADTLVLHEYVFTPDASAYTNRLGFVENTHEVTETAKRYSLVNGETFNYSRFVDKDKLGEVLEEDGELVLYSIEPLSNAKTLLLDAYRSKVESEIKELRSEIATLKVALANAEEVLG